MTDRAALLRAIRANPDDDTPRPVYADWLQENGEPRVAQFIQIQIKLFNMWNEGGPKPDEPDDPGWDRRYNSLLFQENALLWAGPLWTHFQNLLKGSTAPIESDFDVRNIQRGFPDRIEPCHGNWWAEFGDRALEHLPINGVAFWDLPTFARDRYGFRLLYDSRRTIFEVPESDNDNDAVLDVCRVRWPEVRFEQLPRIWDTNVGLAPLQAQATINASRSSRVNRIGRV